MLISLLLGLVVRLVLAPLGWHHYDLFTYGDWAWQLLEEPRSQFYAAPLEVPGDHLPGDLTIMWALAHMTHLYLPGLDFFSLPYKVILKLVPIAADLLLALGVVQVARLLTSERRAILIGAAMALSPAAIVISAVWGQWDSVSMAIVTWSIWLLLTGRVAVALPLLALACLLKPQLGLLLPFYAVADLRLRRTVDPDQTLAGTVIRAMARWMVGGIGSVAAVLAISIPFDVGLPGMGTRWSLVDRIVDAANRYDGTSMGAFNLWYLITPTVRWDGEDFIGPVTYHQTGLVLFAGAWLLALLGAMTIRPWTVAFLWGAMYAMSAAFMVATRSHERYLFPAVVLAMLLLAAAPAWRGAAIWLSAASFVNVYLAYSLYHPRVDPSWLQQEPVLRSLALVNVACFLMAGWRGVTLMRAARCSSIARTDARSFAAAGRDDQPRP